MQVICVFLRWSRINGDAFIGLWTPVVTHDNFGRQMPEVEAIAERVSGAFFQFNSLPALVSKIIQCIQDLRSGTITSESCRKVVLTFYSAEFQRKVFNKAINDLIASR